MQAKEIKVFKFLVILNTIASIAITHQIILYNLEYLDLKIYFILWPYLVFFLIQNLLFFQSWS